MVDQRMETRGVIRKELILYVYGQMLLHSLSGHGHFRATEDL